MAENNSSGKKQAKKPAKKNAPVKKAEKSSAPKKTKRGKSAKTAAAKKKRWIVLIVVAVVLAAAAAAVWFGVRYVFTFQNAEGNAPGAARENYTGHTDPLDEDDPELPKEEQVETLQELRSTGDLNTILQDWATNNTGHSLMQKKDVVNFLVVGLDASEKNSDVIMLVSVNKSEKKLYFSSIMRDCFTYMKTPDRETTAKINAAYANGGIRCLIQTVENDYKIKIDHYVTVNFNTFVEIVDLVGGVELPVQQKEMREMNRIADNREDKLTEYGDSVLLNGRQALLYCRIRKCDWDGDVSRTRRQRLFLSALVGKTKKVSLSDAPELIDTLHKYIKTDCDVKTLVSYATQALTGKWYNYSQVSTVFPLEQNRMDYSGKAWVWIVDYPADAVEMQKLIYGETNIQLSENRRTAKDAVKK